MKCQDLAVDVGDVDLVGIDQGDMSDAGSRKAFGSVSADAAHAEEQDFCVCQTVYFFLTNKKYFSFESGIHIKIAPKCNRRAYFILCTRQLAI